MLQLVARWVTLSLVCKGELESTPLLDAGGLVVGL